MKTISFYVIVLTVFFSKSLFCQKSNQFLVKYINREIGLQQESVKGCVEDNNGFIWIATEMGLYYFNGVEVKKFYNRFHPGLSNKRISKLALDSETGELHVETYPDCNQYVIDNFSPKLLIKKNYWNNYIYNFGNLCFSRKNLIANLFLKTRKGGAKNCEYNTTLFLSACLTDKHLFIPQYNHLEIFSNKGLVKTNNIKSDYGSLLIQFDNDVFHFYNKSIYKFNDKLRYSKYICSDKNILIYLYRNEIEAENIKVFGLKNNYLLLINNSVFKINYFKGELSTSLLFTIPITDVVNINFSKNKDIYFVSTKSNGVLEIFKKDINTIVPNEKNSNLNVCYSVVSTKEDEFFSTNGWNYSLKTNKCRYFNFPGLINERFIFEYNGKFYFESKNIFYDINNGKLAFDFNLSFRKYAFPVKFTGFAKIQNKTYLSDEYSLYLLQNKKLINVSHLNKYFVDKAISGIHSWKSSLVILTNKGVFLYNPFTYSFRSYANLNAVYARNFIQLSKDINLVCTYGNGLYAVLGEKAYKVNDRFNDLSAVHALVNDNKGYLWISTNNGMFCVKKNTFERNIKSNLPIESYIYSTSDGLLTNEFNGGSTHPFLKKDSIIGFPSMKGFVWFSENSIKQKCFKNKIYIVDAKVNDTLTVNETNFKYIFPNSTETAYLLIDYSYLYNQDNITLEYKYSDENNWRKVFNKQIQLSRSHPGERILQLRIHTHGFSSSSDIIFTKKLFFEPKYYETSWFKFFLFFIFFIFVFLSYYVGKKINNQRAIKLQLIIDDKTSELKNTIEALATSTQNLSRSLHQKEILLKELHHRVKNNLQLISSLLNIQSRRLEHMSLHDFINQTQDRIQSMMLIHQALYQKDALDSIRFDDYTTQIWKSLSDQYSVSTKLSINCHPNNKIYFNLNTFIPLGLILNELITNSFKYAFNNKNETGEIIIDLERLESNKFRLTYRDNGPGISPSNYKQRYSFGMQLILIMSQQLGGDFNFHSNSGFVGIITFYIQ